MKRLVPRSLALALLLLAACHSAPPSTALTASPLDLPPSLASVAPHTVRLQGDFKAPIGVQLYTFRELAKTDPVAMFHLIGRMGVTHVEGGSTYGMPIERYRQVLRESGLHTTSSLFGYDLFKSHPDSIIALAHALGAKYVGIAWIPHQGDFKESDARTAIADFNVFGRQMKDAGLTFVYHTHGYEPHPYGDGTLLDLIIRETDPTLVKFEMDVLWTFLPGGDPIALIHKYPGRFKLMHIKDMKPGVPRGSLVGLLPDTLQTPIGEGQVNWPAVLAAAEKDGFEYYYIEDETPTPVANVPKYISYLEHVKY